MSSQRVTSIHLPDAVGAIAGIAFCLLAFLATASFDPLTEATDAEVATWWADPANLRANVISMYLWLACVPCFLLFLTTIRGRLIAAEDGTAPMATFAFTTGVCFAVAVLMAAVSRGLIAQSVKFGDEPLPGPDTLRTITLLSMTTFALVAMPAAAITLAATSWLVVRGHVMASWVGWSGIIVAVAIVVATAFLVGPFTLPLLFLWITATSIELWRTQNSASLSDKRVDSRSAAAMHPGV
jgi:hypothetical protein